MVLWRDAEGTLAILEHRGDIEACSHPPTAWVDAATLQQRLVQAERPVTPPEAAALQAERDAVLAGLTGDERASCPEAVSPQSR